jgi:hypothetical protein
MLDTGKWAQAVSVIGLVILVISTVSFLRAGRANFASQELCSCATISK